MWMYCTAPVKTASTLNQNVSSVTHYTPSMDLLDYGRHTVSGNGDCERDLSRQKRHTARTLGNGSALRMA